MVICEHPNRKWFNPGGSCSWGIASAAAMKKMVNQYMVTNTTKAFEDTYMNEVL